MGHAKLSIVVGIVLYAISILFTMAVILHEAGREIEGGHVGLDEIVEVGTLVGLIGAAGLALILHGVVSRLMSR